MNRKLRAHLILLLTALIWGVAFVAQDIAMDTLEPFTFNGARMLLGGMALLPLVFKAKFANKAQKRCRASDQGDEGITADAALKSKKADVWVAGFWCGIMLFLGSGLQQLGIAETSPGKAGFVTALYIVLVPLVGLFMGKRARWPLWLAVALSTVGLFLLCVTETLTIGLGDLYLLLCAVAFTGHILVVDHFSRRADPVGISCIQFFVCALLCLPVSVIWEHPTLSALWQGILPILYAGILSGAVGYTLQIVAQRDTDPAVASLILCLESVFAALAGWAMLGSVLTARELMGCGLLFLGILLAQWPKKREASPSQELCP